MKYKGYIIDRDDLGRLYIFNTASQYSEDSDRQYIHSGDSIRAAKEEINARIARSMRMESDGIYLEEYTTDEEGRVWCCINGQTSYYINPPCWTVEAARKDYIRHHNKEHNAE